MFEKTFSFWRHLVGQPAAPSSPPASTTTQEDRRLWVRHATDLQGKVQVAEKGDGTKILANIRDLSVGGASLHVDELMVPGQMITVDFPAEDEEIRTVLACVVRVFALGNGKWSIGCVFSRELSHDDLGRIGAGKVPAANEDQRTWVRFSCGLKARCRKVGDTSEVSHAAEVLNISATGIALAVQPTMQAGALLNVDLLDKDGHLVRTILACIVHTTQRSSGDFALGCNFIRELDEDELHSLL